MSFSPERSLSEYTSLVGQARAVFMGSYTNIYTQIFLGNFLMYDLICTMYNNVCRQNEIELLQKQMERQQRSHEKELQDIIMDVQNMRNVFERKDDIENRSANDANIMQELKIRLDGCRQSEEAWNKKRSFQPRQLTRAESSLYVYQIDSKTQTVLRGELYQCLFCFRT